MAIQSQGDGGGGGGGGGGGKGKREKIFWRNILGTELRNWKYYSASKMSIERKNST